MKNPTLSPAMVRTLATAAGRERGNFCPVPRARAAAESAILDAADRRGFVTWDNGVPHASAPRISPAGRAAIVLHLAANAPAADKSPAMLPGAWHVGTAGASYAISYDGRRIGYEKQPSEADALAAVRARNPNHKAESFRASRAIG